VGRQLCHLPAQSALSSALMVKNAFEKTRIRLVSRFNDILSLNLNMMLKIEFKQTNVAHGLMNDIKGYHIHFWSSSNSAIKNCYGGCIVSPVIVASASCCRSFVFVSLAW
jgi:hypothetical protein